MKFRDIHGDEVGSSSSGNCGIDRKGPGSSDPTLEEQ
jgi:hypothetical protein